ncbi:MAG: aspartyl protease [Spirulina sp.]
MIEGEFNSRGELFFEIGLISADGDLFPAMALLDTGFTGWVALDNQDIESLGWQLADNATRDMQTAAGESEFFLYRGNLQIDGEEFTIEALGGDNLNNVLLGLQWLRTRKLIVDYPQRILTLG